MDSVIFLLKIELVYSINVNGKKTYLYVYGTICMTACVTKNNAGIFLFPGKLKIFAKGIQLLSRF